MPTAAKIPWPGGPSLKQNFPFPDTVIYFVSMNPSSPKAYNKTIQSCKYFFEKNPILVCKIDESKFCSYDDKQRSGNSWVYFDVNKCISKFWIIRRFCIEAYAILEPNEILNLTSNICKKLYHCDVELLLLENQNILFDEFKLLVSSVTVILLEDVKMTYKDGSDVMLETIFASIPNIEKFFYDFKRNFSAVNASSIKNIAKLKNFENLIKFGLFSLPEIFQVKDLSDFIKNLKNTPFIFVFNDDISEGYKNQLDSLIDTVIESKNADVIIQYDGQDPEKFEILENRFFDTDEEDGDETDVDESNLQLDH